MFVESNNSIEYELCQVVGTAEGRNAQARCRAWRELSYRTTARSPQTRAKPVQGRPEKIGVLQEEEVWRWDAEWARDALRMKKG